MNFEMQTVEDQSIVTTDAQAEAAVMRTIEAAVILSRRFPRNEESAYAGIIKACKRPKFAKEASYSFPRGGTEIKGPSIYLARECARCWGNIRYGTEIVHMTDNVVKVRAWAWDVETNTHVSAEDEFKKLIQRKTGWVIPDERDLRELVNKHSAITLRNCLLKLFPQDYIEDALKQATQTSIGEATQSPDQMIKGIIVAFQNLNVSVEELDGYLGHALGSATPEELVELQQIGKSIKDGNSRKGEYFGAAPVADTTTEASQQETAKLTMEQITTAPVTNQYHDPLPAPPEDEPVEVPDDVPVAQPPTPKPVTPPATPKKAEKKVPVATRSQSPIPAQSPVVARAAQPQPQAPAPAQRTSNKLPPPKGAKELIEYCKVTFGMSTEEVVKKAGRGATEFHLADHAAIWEQIKQEKGVDA